MSENFFWSKADCISYRSDKSVDEREDSSLPVEDSSLPIAGEYYSQICSVTFKRTCTVELVSVEVIKRAHAISYPGMLPV